MRRSDTIIFPTDFVSIVTRITADSPLQVFHSDSFWILCSILTAWRPDLKGPFRLNSFFCRIVLLPYRTRGNAFVASVHQYILTKPPQGRNTSQKGGDGLGEILGCSRSHQSSVRFIAGQFLQRISITSFFFGSELKRSVDEADLLIPNSKVGPDSDNTSCAWIFCRDWFCCLVVYFLCFLPVSTWML